MTSESPRKPRPRKSAIVQEHDSTSRRAAQSVKGATKPAEMEEGLMEFMSAVDEYKRLSARPFPNLSEIYSILLELGYHKAG